MCLWPELQWWFCADYVDNRGGPHLDRDADLGRVPQGHVCSFARARPRNVQGWYMLARRGGEVSCFSGPVQVTAANPTRPFVKTSFK